MTTLLQMVWVSCEGENSADKEYLPMISLSPYDGFPAYYFPYIKNSGYRSPLVGVTLLKPERKYRPHGKLFIHEVMATVSSFCLLACSKVGKTLKLNQ